MLTGNPARDIVSMMHNHIGWLALAQDTGCSVSLIDAAGRILFVNEAGLRVLGKTSLADTAGRTLQDVFPHEYAQQWLGLVRQCLSAGGPLVHYGVLHGRLYRSTIRPAPVFDGAVPAVLSVCQPNPAESPGDPLALVADQAKALGEAVGPLATLTTKELRVLTLVGEGLRNYEIAGSIDRSVRTVDGHVGALMRKLGAGSRAQLVATAVKAGLSRLK
jgi:DNA-binding CsgD family transcriptional regulator